MSENWSEYLVLGLDAIIFGICSHYYWSFSSSSKLVEKAYRLGVNPDYNSLSPEDRLYVAYQGEVKAVGTPIVSLNAKDVTGVVQRLTIREHAVHRNSSGFWSDQKNVIRETYNIVPFVLERGKTVVEVLEPMNAEILDMDTIHNKFETTQTGFLDSIVGFFNGMRQRGIETTEEMLKQGSVITAIGEVSKDGDGRLQLSSSSQGYPYYLTSLPIIPLLRKLDEQKRVFKWLTLLFGSIGLAVSCVLVKRWYDIRKERLRDEELKKKLEETRKERRKNAREGHVLQENECCVVCKHNPKEIILLPCGHVCICEDCSGSIRVHCPICRSLIENKAAAFIMCRRNIPIPSRYVKNRSVDVNER